MIFSDNSSHTLVESDVIYALSTSEKGIFAARHSGLYQSNDLGQSWHDAVTSLDIERPLTVTAVAASGNHIFAGVLGAILHSYNAGQTWQIVGLALPPPQIIALAISPNFAQDLTVVAATADDGVFVSTDGGNTWVAWNFGLFDAHLHSIAFSPNYARDKVLLVGTETGVFCSNNGGRGWYETEFPVECTPVVALAFSLGSSASGLVFAGTEAHGLFVSIDAGLHWKAVDIPIKNQSINAILSMTGPKKSLWLLLNDDLMYSLDNGHSWQKSNVMLPAEALPMALTPLSATNDAVLIGLSNGSFVTASLNA